LHFSSTTPVPTSSHQEGPLVKSRKVQNRAAQDNFTAVTECDFIPDSAKQTAWHEPVYKLKAAKLLSAAPSQSDKARLIVVSAPHAGDFLKALPCLSLGTRLDTASLRVAIALRLGLPVSSRYTCVCNATADDFRAPALVCRKSTGRRLRHDAVNDLIKRALASADIPSRLEPACLSRDDGKRPDGLTLMPWAIGRCMVWDFTCCHTLAASFLNKAVLGQGFVAEARKTSKYSALAANYTFTPIAIETLGALGSEASAFFSELRTPSAICHSRAARLHVLDATHQYVSAAWQCGLLALLAAALCTLARRFLFVNLLIFMLFVIINQVA
jgi:hypothetical protein